MLKVFVKKAGFWIPHADKCLNQTRWNWCNNERLSCQTVWIHINIWYKHMTPFYSLNKLLELRSLSSTVTEHKCLRTPALIIAVNRWRSAGHRGTNHFLRTHLRSEYWRLFLLTKTSDSRRWRFHVGTEYWRRNIFIRNWLWNGGFHLESLRMISDRFTTNSENASANSDNMKMNINS